MTGELPNKDQLVEAVKTREALTALIKSEGWAILQSTLKARRVALEQEVLHKCLGDGNSVYRQEFMKGQAYQVLLLEQLPDTIIETAGDAVEAIRALLTPEEQEDEDA
jgi:hypothetical protein